VNERDLAEVFVKSCDSSYTEQRARFELLGGTGAAVLGAGVALLPRHILAPLVVPLLIVGLVAHGLAMWAKHRLESSEPTAMPAWSRWAYWACWVLLAGLIVSLALLR
jgi:hypothetical protein